MSTRASAFSHGHMTPSSDHQEPLRAQLRLHRSGALRRLQGLHLQKSSRVYLAHLPPTPQEPSRIHTDPETSPGPHRFPPCSLASYLQRKVETCLRGRRRAGSVRLGSAATGLGHGRGCSPRSAHAGARPPPPAILVQHRGLGQLLTCR